MSTAGKTVPLGAELKTTIRQGSPTPEELSAMAGTIRAVAPDVSKDLWKQAFDELVGAIEGFRLHYTTLADSRLGLGRVSDKRDDLHRLHLAMDALAMP